RRTELKPEERPSVADDLNTDTLGRKLRQCLAFGDVPDLGCNLQVACVRLPHGEREPEEARHDDRNGHGDATTSRAIIGFFSSGTALEQHIEPIPDRIASRSTVLLGRRFRDRKSTRLNSSHVKISYAV